MKKLKRIVLCIILSIVVQCGVLCYADNVLLKESNEFDIKTIEAPVKSFDTDVEISSEAEDIQVSYSGKYITYYIDDKLMLINTKTSEVKEILNNTDILECKWVPNNNTIFIVENESDQVKVKTYNADSDVEQDVCELCKYEEGVDIKFVISTSAEYVSIANENETTIYRIDIDKEVKKIDQTINKLGSMAAFWSKDVFIYQDLETNKFYRYTNGKSSEISLGNFSNLVILKATDNMVFLGEYSQDKSKISKIIYGDDTKDTSTWKTESLDKPKDISDIYINDENDILINDRDEKKITNITKGKDMAYKGEFILINDRVLLSLEDDKVCLKSVKDSL